MSQAHPHNLDLVRRYLAEALSQGKRGALESLVAPDVTFTVAAEQIRGRQAFWGLITGLRAAFPDLRFEEQALIARGDLVAARWTASGTQLGAYRGMPPSGKRFTIPGMSFYRLRAGQIVEGWAVDDSLGMAQQLGLIPALA